MTDEELMGHAVAALAAEHLEPHFGEGAAQCAGVREDLARIRRAEREMLSKDIRRRRILVLIARLQHVRKHGTRNSRE